MTEKNKEEEKKTTTTQKEDKTVSKNDKPKKDDNKIKKDKNEIEKLKSDNKNLNEQIRNLINQVNELKLNNKMSIQSFQDKAKGFQDKAQIEINKVKQELAEKAEQDEKDFKKYGLQKTFESLIEPLINIEVAIKAGKTQGPEVNAYVMGFEMLMNQLFIELESSGLTKIEPTVGADFDPELHQAISTEEGETNKILKVNKYGFKLHDRVIKPAVVIIGK